MGKKYNKFGRKKMNYRMKINQLLGERYGEIRIIKVMDKIEVNIVIVGIFLVDLVIREILKQGIGCLSRQVYF